MAGIDILCRSLRRSGLAVTALAASIASLSADAGAASATSNVGAEVVATSGIFSSAAQGHGTPTDNGGPGVISTAGAAGSTGDVVVISGSGQQAVAFSVTAAANTFYTITLPASTTVSDGVLKSMTVSTLLEGGPRAGTLDSSGNGTFALRTTLAYSATQAAGAYSGTLRVVLEHQ